MSPSFVVRPTVVAAIAAVQAKWDRGRDIQRAETRQLARDHIERTCRSLLDLGFDAVDIPDAFKLVDKDRRWGGLQAFQRAEEVDVFVPFFQRAYIRAAFATPPAERLLQRVPHYLIHHLSPTLRALPSDSPWPPNSLPAYATIIAWNRAANRIRRELRRFRPRLRTVAARQRERIAVLLHQLPRWRERYLDGPNANAWRVLDRDRYEHLTSSRASVEEKAARLESLYLATTVLAFEEDLRAWASRWG